MAAINSDVLKGKWQQLKGEARIQWGKLTDDDLDQIQGNIEKLAGKLQERYGYERAEADREVEDFVRQHTAGDALTIARFRKGAGHGAGPPLSAYTCARHSGAQRLPCFAARAFVGFLAARHSLPAADRADG